MMPLTKVRRASSASEYLPENYAADLPPHDLEAESGVLGCIILGGAEKLDEALELLGGASAFYDLRHQIIYSACAALVNGSKPVDLVLLHAALSASGELESVGGLPYVAALPDRVPSAANLIHYAAVVRDLHRKREMLDALADAARRVRNHAEGEVEPLLDSVEAGIIAANAGPASAEVVPMNQLVLGCISTIELAFLHRNQGLMTGLPTKFRYFDNMTGGLHKKELNIIGARPSTGKTSLLCTLLLNVAVTQGRPCGFLSLEMSKEEITLRLLCAQARANMKQVHSGFITKHDQSAMVQAAAQLSVAPIYIDDRSGITPAQIRTSARRMVARHKIELLGIDHLHEVHVPEARGDEKIQATEATTAAKWCAKELNIAVVALAQLSRSFENESAKSRTRIPRMTDLRGSGSMEQKADVIGILYRERLPKGEEQADQDAAHAEVQAVNLEVCKQRNGPTGTCQFTFLRTQMRYQDAHAGPGSQASAVPVIEPPKREPMEGW